MEHTMVMKPEASCGEQAPAVRCLVAAVLDSGRVAFEFQPAGEAVSAGRRDMENYLSDLCEADPARPDPSVEDRLVAPAAAPTRPPAARSAGGYSDASPGADRRSWGLSEAKPSSREGLPWSLCTSCEFSTLPPMPPIQDDDYDISIERNP